MTIYDGLTEMIKAGMNSTSLVFVNMFISSFFILNIIVYVGPPLARYAV